MLPLKPVELTDLKLAALKTLDLAPERIQVHLVDETPLAHSAAASAASAHVRTVLLLMMHCSLKGDFPGELSDALVLLFLFLFLFFHGEEPTFVVAIEARLLGHDLVEGLLLKVLLTFIHCYYIRDS